MKSSSNVLCPCGERELSLCPGEWEQGCDLGSNPNFVQAVPNSERKVMKAEEIPGLLPGTSFVFEGKMFTKVFVLGIGNGTTKDSFVLNHSNGVVDKWYNFIDNLDEITLLEKI